jgi:hypothetical protein
MFGYGRGFLIEDRQLFARISASPLLLIAVLSNLTRLSSHPTKCGAPAQNAPGHVDMDVAAVGQIRTKNASREVSCAGTGKASLGSQALGDFCKSHSCHAKVCVLDSLHEVIYLHDRRNVLSRRDVLRAHAFWREEMAELEHFASCRLQGTHRQILNWQVGFLFLVEFGARAADGAFAEPTPGEGVRWAFRRSVLKS